MKTRLGMWRAEVPPVLGLALVCVVFFWPILTGQAYLWGDFPERIYPLRQYGLAELAAGRLPVWTPYLFGGTPFLAMIDNGMLYPLNWLLIPLVRDGTLSFLVLEWHALAHVFVLGFGMYCFCRGVSVARVSAFAAGVIWMLSGPIVHQLFHAAVIQTVTWLPFALLFLVRALDRASVRAAGAAGMAWGLMILAGHPQVFLYAAYAMGLYYLVRLVDRTRSNGGSPGALRLTGVFGFVMVLGVALAAAALLPALELAGVSRRAGAGLEGWGLSAPEYRQLVTFVMPGFFGQMGPVTWDYWGPGAAEHGYFWETYVYLGVMPVLLAGVGLVGARGPVPRFLGLLAAFSLVGVVGAVTPFREVLTVIAPGFATFRAHGRLGLVLGFSIAALAGLGLDILGRCEGNQELRTQLRRYLSVTSGMASLALMAVVIGSAPLTRWLAGSDPDLQRAGASLLTHGGRAALLFFASAAVLWAWYLGRARARFLVLATLAVIIGDLFVAGASFNRSPVGPTEYFPETELTRALESRRTTDGGRVRVESTTPRILRMNAGIVFGLETPLDGFASPLRLGTVMPPVEESRSLDLMNVTHEVRTVGGGRSLTILDRPTALPRAWVVRDFVIAPDMSAVVDAMSDSAFDYSTTVTLDRPPEIPIPAVDGPAPERPTWTRPRPDRMNVEVEMMSAGLLVLSEVSYPAWRAYEGGEEREVLRADGTLRAIALPEGRHAVEFRYRSTSIRVGVGISVLALLIAGLAGLGRWPKLSGRTAHDQRHPEQRRGQPV